eukprot:scaffold3737_cov117-Skeletonema_dohrnii-CCMP3373.AAC.6
MAAILSGRFCGSARASATERRLGATALDMQLRGHEMSTIFKLFNISVISSYVWTSLSPHRRRGSQKSTKQQRCFKKLLLLLSLSPHITDGEC